MLVVGVGIALALSGARHDSEPVSLHIQLAPEGQNETVQRIMLTEDDVAKMPSPARRAWLDAAANGNSTFVLSREEAVTLTSQIEKLASDQGIVGSWLFSYRGSTYSMNSRMT